MESTVESSVGYEDPLHFYTPPPEPPSRNRDDARMLAGIDPQRTYAERETLHPSGQQESDEERYRKQQYFLQQMQHLEEMRRERYRLEQQRYDQQREEHHLRERQRTEYIEQQTEQPASHYTEQYHTGQYYTGQYHTGEHPQTAYHADLYNNAAQYNTTGVYSVPQRADHTVDIVAQPDTRPKQAIRYNESHEEAQAHSTTQVISTPTSDGGEALQRVNDYATQVTTWLKSSTLDFLNRFFDLFSKDQSSTSLAVRSGIFVAVIMLMFGVWFQLSGPSATADQAQNNAPALSSSDPNLAILSVKNQPAAAQNSVADGLAILSTQPNASVDTNVDGNNGNGGSDSPQSRPQTVAQALAAAPLVAPTATPTPLPTFTPSPTPTPTVIPTEEIPDEIPEVNIIGSFLDDIELAEEKEVEEQAQVRRTATPTVTPTPLPLSPGRLWSTFVPGPPSQTDHFWIGRPFFSSAKTQIASSNYQFGSTASSRYRVHYGLDISNPMGTEVRSATTGVVIHAGPDDPILLGPYNRFYGNAVVIRLDRRLPAAGGELDVFLLYGHLNSLNVSVGDTVTPDDIVGFVGMRGIAAGPHLHVEVRLGANTYNHIVNPYVWIEPVAGTGAIAVRLLTADGRTWRSARVSLLRYENGRSVWSRYIETYSDDGYLGPDPAWGENGAMGSLKPGTYQVISVLNGERVKAQVQVRAGETTFVEMRSKQ